MKKPLECVLSVYTNSENAIGSERAWATLGPRLRRVVAAIFNKRANPFVQSRNQAAGWREIRQQRLTSEREIHVKHF